MGKLYLITPVGHNALMDARVAVWCAALSRCPGVEWCYVRNQTPDDGRNAVFEDILAKDPKAEWFLPLDADTLPPEQAVKWLLELEVPVSCGPTPIFVGEKDWTWNVTKPDGEWWPLSEPLPSEPFETQRVGGTTLLLHRSVIEAVGYPWFRREVQSMALGNPIKRGGDVHFSDRMRECGYTIWCEPRARCEHYKTVPLGKAFASAFEEGRRSVLREQGALTKIEKIEGAETGVGIEFPAIPTATEIPEEVKQSDEYLAAEIARLAREVVTGKRAVPGLTCAGVA